MSTTRDKVQILAVYGAIAVVPIIIFLPTQYPLSTRVAGLGGYIAALGGALALRPLLRSGGLLGGILLLSQAGMLRHHSDFLPEESKELLAAYNDESEKLLDYANIAFGIFYVSIGTLINGFSGFLA